VTAFASRLTRRIMPLGWRIAPAGGQSFSEFIVTVLATDVMNDIACVVFKRQSSQELARATRGQVRSQSWQTACTRA
jgi:hypothetical protein